MIRVASPIPEPEGFDDGCRKEGQVWIKKQSSLPKRPKDFWSPFRADLRRGFHSRCGYYAMYIHDGQVDHFVSWDTCKKSNTPEKAYEWTNLRFVDGALNSRKRTLDEKVLDPFEIEEGWFEVELPSLLLKTVGVPHDKKTEAALTLERMDLAQGLRALELRWEWYEMRRSGKLSQAGLQDMAPLVGRAVEKWVSEGKGPLPVIPRPVRDPYTGLV